MLLFDFLLPAELRQLDILPLSLVWPRCLKNSIVAEQGDAAACMQEHDVVGRLEMLLAAQIDESRHALA